MSRAESETAMHISEEDALAVLSLFKRIAERGHRIRTQNQADNTDNVMQPTLGNESDSKARQTGFGKE